jgi:hypothetical protein
MDNKDRVSGFKALLESHKTSSSYLIDPDGEFLLWRDLSTEGKLDSIVRDAAYYDVPFEPFVEAVRESIDSVAIEDAALRLAMRRGRELHELESLFPDDGLTEPSPPIVERVKELLNAKSAEHETEEVLNCHKLAALFKEMREDEAAVKQEDAHWCGSEALQKLREAGTKAPSAETGKDKDIER